MKIVRSFRLALLIGAILLLSTTPTWCQVSFSQVDSNIEPLSADNTINYVIPIANEGISTLSYKVALTLGPDKDESSINLVNTLSDIFVDPGETENVTIPVNFHHPSVNKGNFSRWLTNKSDTSTWELAWYKAEIKTGFGSSAVIEDYSGRPKLIKPICDYRNPVVTPSQGTNLDNYTYELTVICSSRDNISLEVGPSLQGPWIDKGIRRYATPGLLQILRWSNTALGFDFNASYYRFKGKSELQPKLGPVRPVSVQFRNNTLTPLNGTQRTVFDYSLEVNASMPIDVQLNVMDIGTGKYLPAGFKNYKNSSTWEKLAWPSFKVASNEELVGSSSYYFSFHYPGVGEGFNSTKDMLGVIYPGPYLSSWEIDASVNPTNGSIYTPFTYVAKVNTSKPLADVELEIQPPSSTIWQGQGKQTYSRNGYILRWPNIFFRGSPEVLGVGKYRLLVDDAVLGEYIGPQIDVAIRNESFKRLPNDNFDYSAEIRSSRPSVDMELMFTDDGVTWKGSGLYRAYPSSNNSTAQSSWETLTWQNQPWHKSIRVDQRKIK